MYNPITRSVEAELFPALRKFGMRFDAYNPLAGGILTGKHKFSDMSDGKIQLGRFEGTNWAPFYQGRYWNESVFTTVDLVRKALDKVSYILILFTTCITLLCTNSFLMHIKRLVCLAN